MFEGGFERCLSGGILEYGSARVRVSLQVRCGIQFKYALK